MMVRHLGRHASTQLCSMRRRGDSPPAQHVYLHELPECWIDESVVSRIVRSVFVSSSLDRRAAFSHADWDLALRVGVSGGWIKRRDGRLVLQSEISDIALPMWCELHLGLILEHTEYAVICLVLALSAFSLGACKGRSIVPSFSYACCYLCNEKEKKINKSGHLHSALKLWARVVLAIRVSEVVVTLCQLLMAGMLLWGPTKSLSSSCFGAQRYLCPALLTLSAMGSTAQLWVTKTAAFNLRPNGSASPNSPFESVAMCLEQFPASCLLLNWIVLVFFGSFSSSNCYESQ